jgi:site-specific recombinase XerD
VITNAKLRELLNGYQDVLDDFRPADGYDCAQLREILLNRGRRAESSTFQDVAQAYIDELHKSKRSGYAKSLELTCKYFTGFARGDLFLADITPATIEGLDRYMATHSRMNGTTISLMMRNVRTIINRAKKTGLVHYEVEPFASYKFKAAPVRQLDLPVEVVRKIRDYETKSKRLRMARDLFMLSFYLGGINLIDLLAIDFRGDPKSVEYVRAKTRNTNQGGDKVVIPVHEDARAIIKAWMNPRTGKLDFGCKFTYKNFSRYLTRCIDKLKEALEIKERMLFYSARKSFAQFAADLGMSDHVIDACLGHSTNARGVIRYYTKVRNRQVEMAVNRVIDYVRDPEKYQEVIDQQLNLMAMRL